MVVLRILLLDTNRCPLKCHICSTDRAKQLLPYVPVVAPAPVQSIAPHFSLAQAQAFQLPCPFSIAALH